MRRHAIPAASAPVISLVGVTMGTVITNAILLEYTFSIPGMFSLMTQALGNADLPVIEGVAIAGALLVVTANLLADFVHAWLDRAADDLGVADVREALERPPARRRGDPAVT